MLKAGWIPTLLVSALTLNATNSEIDAFLSEAIQRADQDAIEWATQQANQVGVSREEFRWLLEEAGSDDGLGPKCRCSGIAAKPDFEPSLYVFMSLSVPAPTWISLSQELQERGGVFVLRGLPDNSFSELSRRVQALTRKGVEAPIQIHPELFSEYAIDAVPAIVVTHGEAYDKVVGNVTLEWALGLINRQGDKRVLEEENA